MDYVRLAVMAREKRVEEIITLLEDIGALKSLEEYRLELKSLKIFLGEYKEKVEE